MTQQIAEYFKPQPVLKVCFLGSFARGEQREGSDVDILIVPQKTVGAKINIMLNPLIP